MKRSARLTKAGLWVAAILASMPVAASPPPPPWWIQPFSETLRDVVARRRWCENELARLSEPVVGQTVDEYGYQHERMLEAPLNPPWVQIDFGRTQRLDAIALFPVQLDWRDLRSRAYAFPRRFRVDLSDDPEFQTNSTVAKRTELDFPEPGVAPVVFATSGQTGRYLRITVTKLAPENGAYFFALAEIMALAGDRNVALGRDVTASSTFEMLPRWSPSNLVDGRTPLGPPIHKQPTTIDGLYCILPESDPPATMGVDLGRSVNLSEVRLHPIHSRLDADIPGYAFPRSFRVEASEETDFDHPVVLLDAKNFPNPGNNPVTIAADGTRARFVRVVLLAPGASSEDRFGLSELQVYTEDGNVARDQTLAVTPFATATAGETPLTTLIDGMTSYGRLTELPEWLTRWNSMRELTREINTLDELRIDEELTAEAQARLALAPLSGLVVLILAGAVRLARQRRRREIVGLQQRFARDLHDEIGSNLASIAVLSEMAVAESEPGTPANEDWQQVECITRETIQSMHELLWVMGARHDSGADLIEQMQRAARRLLARNHVEWLEIPESVPSDWAVVARRNVFLFFKEALANTARHSAASRVELAVRIVSREFQLDIRDNGTGFDNIDVPYGTGLSNLRARARDIGGRVTIASTRGAGTSISLRVPL